MQIFVNFISYSANKVKNALGNYSSTGYIVISMA